MAPSSPPSPPSLDEPSPATECKEAHLQRVEGDDSRCVEGDDSTRTQRRRSTWSTVCLVFSLFLGLAWLAPILYLLVANIRGDTIGAAAWCPVNEGCHVISYEYNGNVTTASLNERYDTDNHNLLGALQFVAKALEVWYIYIATSLVWYVTVLLARRPGGLPIGYLLTHMEFKDLRALINPLLYSTAGGCRPTTQALRRHRRHLYIFLAFIILMCIITNLMGPSVAVLVLPTLNWKAGVQTPDALFGQYLAGAPTGSNAIPGCSGEDFELGMYNCTEEYYGNSLDALIIATAEEDDQSFNTPYDAGRRKTFFTFNTATGQEQAIPFSFNTTASKNYNQSSDVIWSLSRQTLRHVSSDFEDLYSVVLGDTTDPELLDHYGQYNSSVELELQRYGPVIGLPYFRTESNLTVTQLADDQFIRCYTGFSPTGDMTKCMRTGLGWNTSTAMMKFYLDLDQTVNHTVQITAYWSDKALYIEQPPGQTDCFPNAVAPELLHRCDYDMMFESTGAALDPTDHAHDMFVTEFRLPNYTSPDSVVVMQFFPHYGFATYSIDVTNIWPSLPAAIVANPPDPEQLQSIAVHPAWYLAAWSANEDDDIASSTDRSFNMQQALTDLIVGKYIYSEDAMYRFMWFAQYAMAQATSLVPYTVLPVPADGTNVSSLQPLLWSSMYNQVWGRNIASRTSKVAVVVCGLGILTVLARTAVVLILRIGETSSFDILTAAMRHSHQGEMQVAGGREVDRARISYRFLGDESDLRFQHVRHPDAQS